MGAACRVDCQRCPAAARCGRTPNFCQLGRCRDCKEESLLRLDVRRAIVEHLGGLDLGWSRPVRHHHPGELPLHLPVLVQAYADLVEMPWIALHGARLLGAGGRLTPKHRGRSLREVYRLGSRTRLALELYVEDRVLEGVWARRRQLLEELAGLGLDLVLAPNFSVWRDASRFLVTWNLENGTSGRSSSGMVALEPRSAVG